MHPVGTVPLADDFADGIGKGRDLADAAGDGGEAIRVEAEAVDHGGGEAVLLGGGDIKGVGGEDFFLAGEELVGHGRKDGVLLVARELGELAGGREGLLAHAEDFGLQIGSSGGHGAVRS